MKRRWLQKSICAQKGKRRVKAVADHQEQAVPQGLRAAKRSCEVIDVLCFGVRGVPSNPYDPTRGYWNCG